MQKILEYAEKNGYGTRISLGPAKYDSNIHPGKFYAKIGFEPSPIDIKYAQTHNATVLYEHQFAMDNPDLPEYMLNRLLKNQPYEQVDGRFVSRYNFAGEVFLTHPEVLRNYPL